MFVVICEKITSKHIEILGFIYLFYFALFEFILLLFLLNLEKFCILSFAAKRISNQMLQLA